MIRCRVLYQKTEPLRYTGMLDIQHIWERLFRRAHLNLAYSQGFHPQPRIQQAAPLPLGFLSSYELLDFWLDSTETVPLIKEKIHRNTHPGLEITHLEEIDLSAPILQSQLESSSYLVTSLLEIDPVIFSEKWNHLMAERSIIRTRRGKEYDLRTLIQTIDTIESKNGSAGFQLTLSAREAATGRPEEVIAAMDMNPFTFRYKREKLTFSIPVFFLI